MAQACQAWAPARRSIRARRRCGAFLVSLVLLSVELFVSLVLLTVELLVSPVLLTVELRGAAPLDIARLAGAASVAGAVDCGVAHSPSWARQARRVLLIELLVSLVLLGAGW